VIIPVHQGNHWTAMMVDLAQQRLVFFDSFLGQNRRAVANVKQWVMDEAKVRLGIGGGGEVFFACLFGGGVLPVG
jgi:Ulp1 family protease